jgi:hypothetical protein
MKSEQRSPGILNGTMKLPQSIYEIRKTVNTKFFLEIYIPIWYLTGSLWKHKFEAVPA